MKDHGDKIEIARGQWVGWQEFPPRPGERAVWDTPALITGVTPLKSGKGILRISFIAVLNPVAPSRRTVDLRVIIHGPHHLVGSFVDEAGTPRTVALMPLDLAWIENRCGRLWARFPGDARSS
jgi:hypothetical protein